MTPIPSEDKQTLTPGEIAGEGLDDWRLGAGTLRARFATGTFAAGMALLEQIAAAAEEADHHPDVDLRYPHLDVTLTSHDVDGITRRDVRLARRTSEFAAALGVSAASDDLDGD